MKIKIFAFLLFILTSKSVFSQNQTQQNRKIIFYSFILNVVPDQFKYPLIGFVNIAKGNQKNLHLGFINYNQKMFSGAEISYVNIIGESCKGLQLGFINFSGISLKGAQIGFVNYSKNMKGLQLGFINITDSIEKGLPIGFFSIVKKNGYQAVDFGFSELFVLHFSTKIGVEKLYTTFALGYNKDLSSNKLELGIGLGTILKNKKSLFINPEIIVYSPIINANHQHVNFSAGLGYKITKNVSIIAGPSVTWSYSYNEEHFEKPFYSLLSSNLNNSNELLMGIKSSLRFSLN